MGQNYNYRPKHCSCRKLQRKHCCSILFDCIPQNSFCVCVRGQSSVEADWTEQKSRHSKDDRWEEEWREGEACNGRIDKWRDRDGWMEREERRLKPIQKKNGGPKKVSGESAEMKTLHPLWPSPSSLRCSTVTDGQMTMALEMAEALSAGKWRS